MQNGSSHWESKKSPIFQSKGRQKGSQDHRLLSTRQTSPPKTPGPMEVVGSLPASTLGKAWYVTPASGPSSLIYGFVDSAQPGAQRPTPGFAVKNPCNLGEVISRALSSILEFCRQPKLSNGLRFLNFIVHTRL